MVNITDGLMEIGTSFNFMNYGAELGIMVLGSITFLAFNHTDTETRLLAATIVMSMGLATGIVGSIFIAGLVIVMAAVSAITMYKETLT